MICISQTSRDPYFNMAVEEHLLNSFDEEIFMLWQNESAVIVGRYQNTLAEINREYVEANNIAVVRRLTGGGAVFHDAGNLNFTFIRNGTDPDFAKFTGPVVELLRKLGADARFEGRNDISIDGKKVSGNAMLVAGSRILVHGTLLFSANLERLSAALNANPLKFDGKAVQSVRSRVANIRDLLPEPMTVERFAELIMTHIFQSQPRCQPYSLSPDDRAAAERLKTHKYATWEWNYGHSPAYAFSKTVKTPGGTFEVKLNASNGIITAVKLFGDFFGSDIERFEALFVGCRHESADVEKTLRAVKPGEYFAGADPADLLPCFF
ncbi:MAG: lipoate--protein ligase [Prevotellaceae bacterium]|nr:lipoate--protein ligase [Prevotellaceae bacterium]